MTSRISSLRVAESTPSSHPPAGAPPARPVGGAPLRLWVDLPHDARAAGGGQAPWRSSEGPGVAYVRADYHRRLALSCAEAWAAAEFSSLGRPLTETDHEIVIGDLEHHPDGPGLYVWLADYPERGAVRLGLPSCEPVLGYGDPAPNRAWRGEERRRHVRVKLDDHLHEAQRRLVLEEVLRLLELPPAQRDAEVAALRSSIQDPLGDALS